MNFPVVLIAFFFWFHQNNYFGWNGSPKSGEEVIADGIVCLLLAIAILAGRP